MFLFANGKNTAFVPTSEVWTVEQAREHFKKSASKKGPVKPSQAKLHIEKVFLAQKIKYVKEHRFHKVRKFRFDYAVPEKMLAIEYEGLMSAKSRHTTISGFSKDTTKYNLAQNEGWTVLRYTALTYRDFEKDITDFFQAYQTKNTPGQNIDTPS